jgi:hypothetical protein
MQANISRFSGLMVVENATFAFGVVGAAEPSRRKPAGGVYRPAAVTENDDGHGNAIQAWTRKIFKT